MHLGGYSTSSGLLAVSAQVYSGPCALVGVDVLPPTSGQAVVTVYDSKSGAAGLILSECIVDAGQSGLVHEYSIPVAANNGLYVSLSGSGASFIVRFFPG